MPVPKKKTSKSKRDMRRAHDALTAPNWIICNNCGEPVQRHHVCRSCGYYRGRQYREVEASQ
ncbi:MAG: 50S ribosomal protein L32 [Bdellovibrionales bacterium]|nr:50S ribosomal protein L32 [Bdellovibrionales bacterium]